MILSISNFNLLILKFKYWFGEQIFLIVCDLPLKGYMSSAKSPYLLIILFGYAVVLSLFRINQNYIPNWDTLCYLSLAYNIGGENDSAQRHLMAYHHFRDKTDSVSFANLTKTDVMSDDHKYYRLICFEDYSAFTQQEIFHKSKILYVFVAITISKLGYDLFDSFHLISFWSVIFLMLFLILILLRYFSLAVSIIIAIVFYSHPSIYEIQMLGTPDAFSAMLVVGFYFFLSNKSTQSNRINNWVTFIFGLLAVITRSENIIFILPIFTAYWLLKRRKSMFSLHYLFFSMALFLIAYINSFMQNLSWKLVFYHSFIDLQLYPLKFSGSISFKQYFVILYQYFIPFIYQNHFWVYFILLAIITYKRFKEIFNLNYFIIIFLIGISVFCRFALYPFPDERYYIHFFVIPFIFYDLIRLPKINPIKYHSKLLPPQTFSP